MAACGVSTVRRLAVVAAAAVGLGGLGAGCQPKALPSSVVATDAADTETATDGQTADGTASSDSVGGDAPTAVDATNSDAGSKDKEPMAEFPAGSYYQGASAAQVAAGLSAEDELPQHLVQFKGFWLDKHEVTVTQFEACIASGICSAAKTNSDSIGCNLGAPGRANHPINCVTWAQAFTYCQWAGKRLPTEAEWECAARGRDSGPEPRTYPWGNQEPDCSLAVFQDAAGNGCGQKATWPVCSKAAGNSPQGLCDLAGNVSEYTSDWYYLYVPGVQTDPVGPKSGAEKLLRGGSRAVTGNLLRASVRSSISTDKNYADIGFRCAL